MVTWRNIAHRACLDTPATSPNLALGFLIETGVLSLQNLLPSGTSNLSSLRGSDRKRGKVPMFVERDRFQGGKVQQSEARIDLNLIRPNRLKGNGTVIVLLNRFRSPLMLLFCRYPPTKVTCTCQNGFLSLIYFSSYPALLLMPELSGFQQLTTDHRFTVIFADFVRSGFKSEQLSGMNSQWPIKSSSCNPNCTKTHSWIFNRVKLLELK